MTYFSLIEKYLGITVLQNRQLRPLQLVVW